MRRNVMVATAALVFFCAATAQAAGLKISLGIRETGGSGPPFANGGSTGGIEFVNRDGQTLTADGTWQLFTFTPATDALTAFAGTTANSVLEAGMEWVVLEHVRILNDEGITAPIRLWIDEVLNDLIVAESVEGFEGFAAGTEAMFQEPGFSGSTSANVVAGSTSAVTGAMAFDGVQSVEANFQFVDADPTRWVRLTTSNAPNRPNPAVRVRIPGGPDPSVLFYAKAVVVPEPGTAALVGLGGLALIGLRRRAA